MTSLDDALNESTVVYGPHQLRAQWREASANDEVNNPDDSLTNLSGQLGDQLQVTHSIDDALPDPVTMTTGNDAAGALGASLVGREGLTLFSSGLRTFTNVQTTGNWSSGAATKTLSVPITGASYGDNIVVAVTISDSTATLNQVWTKPTDQWDLVGVVTDSTISTYVYYKRRWTGGNQPIFLAMSDKNVSYIGQSIVFWAVNPLGSTIDYKVSNVSTVAEASSTTAHVVSSQLNNKGYRLAFFGNDTSGGVVTTTGATKISQNTLNGLSLTSAVSSFLNSGIDSVTGTSATATALMTMAAVSIEPYARPRMSARQWFSPFNKDSPIYNFARDTADVVSSLRVLTSTGSVDTQVFKGQMSQIAISGDDVTLNAISKARIQMNRSINLPIVSGNREGMHADWLATYLMARGGSFVGPAPNVFTRYWNPLYGSLHAGWGTNNAYNVSYYWDTVHPLALFGVTSPHIVDGHFLLGMHAQQRSDKTIECNLFPRDVENFTVTDFPHLYEGTKVGPVMADFMSITNSRGRASWWMKGDAAVASPSYLPSSNDWLLQFDVRAIDRYNNFAGYVQFRVSSSTRRPVILMGNTTHGFGSTSPSATYALPTDSAWHFYAFYWDFAAGTYTLKVDGNDFGTPSNSFATGGWNDTSQLSLTDDQFRANGGSITTTFSFHLPCSDVLIDSGNPTWTSGYWDDLYPIPAAPGANAVMRSTTIPMNGLATEAPVNAWDTLAEVARSTLSSYRVDENDAINFLPLSYFGETAQMTPAAVQDTRTNTAALEATVDSSKIRNVVNVQFSDSRVDANPQPVLRYLSMIELPPGTTIVTLPMDLPAVEIHGAANPTASDYQITNLTSTQITTPSLPNAHYVTINAAADGTAGVLSSFQVKAFINSVSAQSIDIMFVNSTKSMAYLTNSGQGIPFLQILGYALRQTDGYSTVRDDTSVNLRGERALDAELPWIQRRNTAVTVAGEMLAILARPRPEIVLQVRGDPRRKPGQLITVQDADGIQIDGSWRVLSVSHDVNGAGFTQTLTAVQVLPAAVWDGLPGWDNAVWGP